MPTSKLAWILKIKIFSYLAAHNPCFFTVHLNYKFCFHVTFSGKNKVDKLITNLTLKQLPSYFMSIKKTFFQIGLLVKKIFISHRFE